MNEINITSAKYGQDLSGNNSCVIAIIDNKSFVVPLEPANRHYAAILEMVDAGTLAIAEADITIAEADNGE